jgi:hypothetical protein
MASLGRLDVPCTELTTVFVSHFHGDHCFGLPFLLLNLFYHSVKDAQKRELRIIAPRGIEQRTRDLCALALGEDHPCIQWIGETCRFLEINKESYVELIPGYTAGFFQTEHFTETYGFLLSRNGSPVFAYVPDTLWCPSVARMLAQRPPAVLIDLGGDRDDPAPVHLSEADLVEHALPITGTLTRYYGTHLKQHKESALPVLSYVRAGVEIEIS